MKKAKFFNNCIDEPFFDIPLDQVCRTHSDYNNITYYGIQVSLPALHITLGIFGRLFELLEQSCHSLDLQLAHLSNSGPAPEPYQKYVELVQTITSLKEKASREHQKSLVLP